MDRSHFQSLHIFISTNSFRGSSGAATQASLADWPKEAGARLAQFAPVHVTLVQQQALVAGVVEFGVANLKIG
jgi:hypothetical protein